MHNLWGRGVPFARDRELPGTRSPVAPGVLHRHPGGLRVLTWLYEASGGSVLMVALWHATYNLMSGTAAAHGLVAAIVSAVIGVGRRDRDARSLRDAIVAKDRDRTGRLVPNVERAVAGLFRVREGSRPIRHACALFRRPIQSVGALRTQGGGASPNDSAP